MVSNISVYRIESSDKSKLLYVGDVLSYPMNKDESLMTDSKKGIEDEFEKVRLKCYENQPSRKRGLFVIPLDLTYVNDWADIKFAKSFAEYCLLTLNLEGELIWHDADLFNHAFLPFYNNSIEELACRYWEGLCDSYDSTELVEGLFFGEATVLNKQIMCHKARV